MHIVTGRYALFRHRVELCSYLLVLLAQDIVVPLVDGLPLVFGRLE
jgi:hypothetical protein